MIAKMVTSPGISAQVLITLALILAASSMTFWVLVRRWESHRQWHALSEWASERKFRIRSIERDGLPPLLEALAANSPSVRLYLGDGRIRLVQVQTAARQLPAVSALSSGPEVWNLLIRPVGSAWHATGLRPTEAKTSVLDLFSLAGFPMLGTTERFTVFGTDSVAARALSNSMIRSLLPPDIGLLLRGQEMILDFSDRPFDAIELDRMLALAKQVAEKLPIAEG